MRAYYRKKKSSIRKHITFDNILRYENLLNLFLQISTAIGTNVTFIYLFGYIHNDTK